MNRAHLLAYFSFPALIALAGLILGLRHEPLSVDALISYVVWGGLFYAAPYIVWAVIAALAKPITWVWHAGFVATSCALAFTGALSILGPHDPSGLPYQWFIYWPLAGILIIGVLVAWWMKGRRHAGV